MPSLGHIADTYGRRYTILIASLVFFFGSLLMVRDSH